MNSQLSTPPDWIRVTANKDGPPENVNISLENTNTLFQFLDLLKYVIMYATKNYKYKYYNVNHY